MSKQLWHFPQLVAVHPLHSPHRFLLPHIELTFSSTFGGAIIFNRNYGACKDSHIICTIIMNYRPMGGGLESVDDVDYTDQFSWFNP